MEKMQGGKIIQLSEKDTVKALFNFVEVSRMCPALRTVVIRDEHSEKEKVQKWFILGTLREACRQFKEDPKNPKIGFSLLFSLQTRNCVLAGSAGTQAV